jgi:UDPglucose--hexose-1-phosphate uridylyltransferase
LLVLNLSVIILIGLIKKKGGNMHEIRYDRVLDRKIIVASLRSKRPTDFKPTLLKHPQRLVREKDCDFCPGNEGRTPPEVERTEENGKWLVRVFANQFAPLSPTSYKAYGISEIIVDTPYHGQKFSQFSIGHIIKILDVYISRIKKLSKRKKIKYVFIFKNSGKEAGASLVHEHTQLVAFPYIPDKILQEAKRSKKYKKEKKSCYFCDMVKKETKGPRKIYSDKNVISFAPYTSIYHYEAWILPRRHIVNLTDLNTEEKISVCKALQKIISKLDLHNISYNYLIRISPPKEDVHFRIEIIPRENVWAGVELGSGIIINSISPKEAAKFYKE